MTAEEPKQIENSFLATPEADDVIRLSFARNNRVGVGDLTRLDWVDFIGAHGSAVRRFLVRLRNRNRGYDKGH